MRITAADSNARAIKNSSLGSNKVHIKPAKNDPGTLTKLVNNRVTPKNLPL